MKLISILALIFSISELYPEKATASDVLLNHEKSWHYVNIENPKRSTTIYFNPSGIALGDLLKQAFVCNSQSGYHCVTSDDFVLAIPSNVNPLPDTWEYKSELFSVVDEVEYEVFGVLEKVALIRSSQEHAVYQLLYSDSRGLIGFGSMGSNGDKSGGLYLLNGVCGLGALASCSQ